MSQEPRINPKWKDYLRELSEEEFAELERSCLAEGIREDIIVSHDLWILDGAHRFRIAKKHGLPYRIRVVSLASEAEYELWIRTNQHARRNCTPEELSYQRGLIHEIRKAKNPEKSPKGHWRTTGNTAAEVAAETGVSESTVKRDAKKFRQLQKLPENLKTAYLAGTMKLTDDELAELSELSEDKQQQIARLSRTEGKSISDSIQQVCPKRTKKSEAERTLSTALAPLVKTQNDLRLRVDGIVEEFGGSTHADSYLRHSDQALIQLKKWAKAS